MLTFKYFGGVKPPTYFFVSIFLEQKTNRLYPPTMEDLLK